MATQPEQCCGNCRHWTVFDAFDDTGYCAYELPFWAWANLPVEMDRSIFTTGGSGTDCPAWQQNQGF